MWEILHCRMVEMSYNFDTGISTYQEEILGRFGPYQDKDSADRDYLEGYIEYATSHPNDYYRVSKIQINQTTG